MTKDEIIDMAVEAVGDYRGCDCWPFFTEELEIFANLVAAAEQKRCIGIIHGQCGSDNVAQRTVDEIRGKS